MDVKGIDRLGINVNRTMAAFLLLALTLGAAESLHRDAVVRAVKKVMSVEADGPADLAGLKTSYVIQAIENQSPRIMMELARIVHGLRRGDRARLTVVIEKRSGNFIQQRQTVAEVMAR